jgi:hypothetical protein
MTRLPISELVSNTGNTVALLCQLRDNGFLHATRATQACPASNQFHVPIALEQRLMFRPCAHAGPGSFAPQQRSLHILIVTSDRHLLSVRHVQAHLPLRDLP